MDESQRIERLRALFERAGSARPDGVELAIGDDAAILTPRAGTLLWTVDAQVEDVHFRRDWLSWNDCGYRSFVAAASDVSAMAGSPWCALSALTLTADISDEALEQLALGQRAASLEVGAPVVGGNLSLGAVVTVTTTVMGTATAAHPLRRSGARPGDGLWLAGRVGLAAAGLRALSHGSRDSRVDAAVNAWRRPRPLVHEGPAMAGRAHAAIDVSDGVAIDAARVAAASGVCLVLDSAALLASAGDDLVHACEATSALPLDLVLGGGEDYALIAASDVEIEGFVRIGEVREGAGLLLRDQRAERAIAATGFDHFGGGRHPPRAR